MEANRKEDNCPQERLQFFVLIVSFLAIHLVIATIFNLIFQNMGLKEGIRGYSLYSLKNILTIIITVYLGLYVMNKMIEKGVFLMNPAQMNSDKNQKISQNPIKVQENDTSSVVSVIFATLFLLCIVIFVDYVSYQIPHVYEYQKDSLDITGSGEYLYLDLSQMMIISLIFHFSVAFREEFFFRKFLLTAGGESLKKNTSFIMCAFLFGMVHFSYIFIDFGGKYSAFFPFLWFLNAFIVGLLFSYFYQTYNTLIPLIIIHWINNSLSAINIKLYLDGYSQNYIFQHIYLPFIILGLVLFIILFKKIYSHMRKLVNKMVGYLYECQEDTLMKLMPISPLVLENQDNELKTSSKKSKVDKWKEQVETSKDGKQKQEEIQRIQKKNTNNGENGEKTQNIAPKPKLQIKYFSKSLGIDVLIGITLWLFISLLFI